jgi:glycosyltransferase involved in cell wall biosynthesis
MTKTKVLYILHNHPALSPGGSEAYAMQVYDALRGSEEFEPVVLARAGAPYTEATTDHGGSPFAMVGDDPNQYLFYTSTFAEYSSYDVLMGKWWDKRIVTRYIRDFLVAQQPDVVHIQHTAFIGYDVVSAVRRALPDIPILYTLHEFVPICHHYGQMVRTGGRGLCDHASPRRCHECFPQHSPQQFFLREQFIKGHFSHVDTFLAPSRFLMERYVAWGIPAERIRHEPLGIMPSTPVQVPDRGTRNRFSFFGVMTPFKGVDVLLKAMEMLGPDFDGELTIHGANYEHQPDDVQEKLDRLMEATQATVTYAGPYDHDTGLPSLMAQTDWVVVPSTWWENAPLVIQEAFQHGRPVICSDIGGMAEHVAHHVNGLHFRVGDPGSLAETIESAATRPELWKELRAGIPHVRSVDEHVRSLEALYRESIERRRAGSGNGALAGASAAAGEEDR